MTTTINIGDKELEGELIFLNEKRWKYRLEIVHCLDYNKGVQSHNAETEKSWKETIPKVMAELDTIEKLIVHTEELLDAIKYNTKH